MRIIEVIIHATDPIGVNTVVGNHIEDPNTGEGDNKTITGANTKVTMDNLIPLTEAKIITMAIIEVHDPGSRNCAIFVLYTVSIVPSFTSRV